MGLYGHEVYRRVGPVDISSLLKIVDTLAFEDTGNLNAQTTPAGSVPPSELVDVIKQIPLGGHAIKWVCRKLAPYQGIALHDDCGVLKRIGDFRRFHIPIITHPYIMMHWPEDYVWFHLAVGWQYEIRIDRPHEVINDTGSERIHIQIDQIGATI